MGNTVVWKPSPTQQLAASLTMELLEEAGLPPGVINMLPGDGLDVSKVALSHPDLAGIHFTGSTPTFQHLWRTVGENIAGYRSYPRIVGETGGKDFIVAHPSADPDVLRVAMIRGAFEFQGQKCSAASRAYVAKSVWDEDAATSSSPRPRRSRWATSPTSRNFMGAVIDDRAFAKHKKALGRVQRQQAPRRPSPAASSTTRSATSCGPTIVQSTDPTDQMFKDEYFGPILAVHVYDDARYESVVDADGVVRAVRPDRRGHRPGPPGDRLDAAPRCASRPATSTSTTSRPARSSGQQPFGGARASGTNDKAGAPQNLLRWTSPRSIKETSCRRPTTATRTWADGGFPAPPGAPATTRPVIGLFDSAVDWLVAEGLTEQWGDRPWSRVPRRVEPVASWLGGEGSWLAEVRRAGPPPASCTSEWRPATCRRPTVPEDYVVALVTSAHPRREVQVGLLDHARGRRTGHAVDRLRVDCFAGNGGRLVAFYESCGFTRERAVHGRGVLGRPGAGARPRVRRWLRCFPSTSVPCTPSSRRSPCCWRSGPSCCSGS